MAEDIQNIDDEEEIRPERIIPEEEDNSPPPDRSDRINPILEHLQIDGVTLDLDSFRDQFNKLWAYEEGDTLPEDEQRMTTVCLFIYISHLALDDNNINTVRSREHILNALTEWQKPETDKQIEAEKSSDNPFKTFVEQGVPRMDETHTWRNFQLTHKKQDEKIWDLKMKNCWFAQFFIRYGRVDFIETACGFDKIPYEARKDYVQLKLSNTFAKLGSFCQFKYTPVK